MKAGVGRHHWTGTWHCTDGGDNCTKNEKNTPHSTDGLEHGVDPSKSCSAVRDCKKQMAPNLFLIAYGHSGSTSLADALNEHPQLSYGSMKEHRYFCKETTEEQKSWSEYLNEFNVDCHTARTFDATPFYFEMGSNVTDRCAIFHEHGIGALQKFKKYLGSNGQLVVQLRNPIDWHCSREPQDCADFLTSKNWTKLVDKLGSCYADHLEPWLTVFNKSQVLFVQSEEFFENQQAVLSKIFEFAGVPDSSLTIQPQTSGRRRNHLKSTFALEDRKAFYQMPLQLNCKQRLESLTGLKMKWEGF